MTITVARSFAQTPGAGKYTACVQVPPGAVLHDILVSVDKRWDGATAVMDVGDSANPAGYYAAVDLTSEIVADEGDGLTFAAAPANGAYQGAYLHGHGDATQRYSDQPRLVTGVITATGSGDAGRTLMTVVYSLPTEQAPATKS